MAFETRVRFGVEKLGSWDKVFELCTKIEEVVEQEEGVEWYYSETTFMGVNAREIGFMGESSKREEVEKLCAEYGVEVEFEVFEEEEDGEE